MKRKLLSFLLAAAMTVNMVMPVAGAEIKTATEIQVAEVISETEVVDVISETDEITENIEVIEDATVADEAEAAYDVESAISTEEVKVESAEDAVVIDDAAADADGASVEALISQYELSAEQKADKANLLANLDSVFGVSGLAAKVNGEVTALAVTDVKAMANAKGIEYIDDEIVYMTDSEADAKMVAKMYGGTLESYEYEVAVIKLPKNVSVVSAVMQAAAADTNLPMVSPNFKYSVIGDMGSDPKMGSGTEVDIKMGSDPVGNASDPYIERGAAKYQWFLDFVGAKEAWAKGYTGRGIKIAVIDTGVNVEHIDLANNTTDGKAFYDGKKGSEFSKDTHYHGTHVAGIVAGDDNGQLGCGVAPDATVTGYAVFNGSGGYTSDITRGVNAAKADGSFNIINMSLGGYGKDSSLEKACTACVNAGIAVICAAGNDNTSSVSYPAGYEACISIAALDQDGTRANYSNYGKTVDYCFPGSDIWACDSKNVNEYRNLSGTSMASPVAAGVAAIIMQANPDIASAKSKAGVTKLRQIMTNAAFESPSSSKYAIGVGTTYLPTALGSGTGPEPAPVENPVTDIEITATSSVRAGKSFTVSCKVFPEDATNKNVKLSYKGTDGHVKIDKNTVTVSKKASGTYTIYASSADGYVKDVPHSFEVRNGYITQIKLDKKKLSLFTEAGKSGALTGYALTAKVKGKKDFDDTAITFESSNTNVATVDENGNVEAVGSGTAKITCKSTDGTKVKAVCTVKVLVPMSDISIGANGNFDLSEISIKRGKSAKLSIKAGTEYGTPTSQKVKWKSDSKKIRVDQRGKVTVLGSAKVGDSATITVKAADGSGVTATIEVVVE